jgi:hypothetical protein
MNSLVERLRGDPRVIRWTTLKVAETAADMARVKAKEAARDIPFYP